ncbi:MAG: hypothetical protein NT003_03280 [Candidatus Magasanikbacteria bacterium]|nr:hypothetical protein [Candidatus Magasanikbacteria bacterium]
MKRFSQFKDFGAIPDSVLTELKRVMREAGFSIDLAESIIKYPEIAERMVQAAFEHVLMCHDQGLWSCMQLQVDLMPEPYRSSGQLHDAIMRVTNVIASPGNAHTLVINGGDDRRFREAEKFYLTAEGMPRLQPDERVFRYSLGGDFLRNCQLVWETHDFATNVGKTPHEVMESGQVPADIGALAALCMHRRWHYEVRSGRQPGLWIGGLFVQGGANESRRSLLLLPDKFSKEPGRFTRVEAGTEDKMAKFMRKNNIQWTVPTVIARY